MIVAERKFLGQGGISASLLCRKTSRGYGVTRYLPAGIEEGQHECHCNTIEDARALWAKFQAYIESFGMKRVIVA